MSPKGRPEVECRSAQHEGSEVGQQRQQCVETSLVGSDRKAWPTFTLCEDDLAECIELAGEGFEALANQRAAVEQWFECRLRRNPWQTALPGFGVGIREPGGRLMGFRAMFAQPWWLDGRSTIVAFAAHTVVSSKARGRGLGGQLIDASRAFAAITGSTSAGDVTQRVYQHQGFAAIGGQDNGFFRFRCGYAGSMASRLGPWLGRMVGAVLDLRLATSLRGLTSVRDLQLTDVDRCGTEFDALWQQVRQHEMSCLERSSRYLNHRLFEAPTVALRLSALRERSLRLRAAAVWTTLSYSRYVRAAVLRDVICPVDDGPALRTLIGHLARRWRAEGLTWVNIESAAPALIDLWTELGYERLPSHGNRYWVHADPPLSAHQLERWHRSGLDGDYFDVALP